MARSVRAVHVVSCYALQTALLDGVAMDFPVSDVATRQDAFIVSGWMLDKRHRPERLWVHPSTGPINLAFDRFCHGGLTDSGPEDRFGCISDAERETNKGHVTLTAPEALASRWRGELDPQIAQLACSKRETPLMYFGYSL